MHVNDKNHLLIPSEYDDTWLYIEYTPATSIKLRLLHVLLVSIYLFDVKQVKIYITETWNRNGFRGIYRVNGRQHVVYVSQRFLVHSAPRVCGKIRWPKTIGKWWWQQESIIQNLRINQWNSRTKKSNNKTVGNIVIKSQNPPTNLWIHQQNHKIHQHNYRIHQQNHRTHQQTLGSTNKIVGSTNTICQSSGPWWDLVVGVVVGFGVGLWRGAWCLKHPILC